MAKDIFIKYMKSLKRIIREEIDNSFDWVNDILDQQNSFKYCLANKLLTLGDVVRLKGHIYNSFCGFISLPTEGVRVKITDVRDYDIMFTVMDGFSSNCDFGDYYPGDRHITVTLDGCGDNLFIEDTKNINESDELDWLKSMVKNDTIDFYNKYDLLKPNKKYQLSGSYWVTDEDGDFLKHLPDEGVNVEYKTQEDNWFIFKILDDFVMNSVYHHKGDFLYLEDNEVKEIYIKPLEDTINENDDFDWVRDIKPAINWNNIKPEDLINRDFILIDRNRLYTIKGYNTSTGQFNIHNHETGKEHRLSLSEIEGLMFMGDIEFVI